MMAAVPNATIIGFTGTPVARTAQGEGTFKIFGTDDVQGYLDKYSIGRSRMRRHCRSGTPWRRAR
jgi:type I restriction enzyme, R subunit